MTDRNSTSHNDKTRTSGDYSDDVDYQIDDESDDDVNDLELVTDDDASIDIKAYNIDVGSAFIIYCKDTTERKYFSMFHDNILRISNTLTDTVDLLMSDPRYQRENVPRLSVWNIAHSWLYTYKHSTQITDIELDRLYNELKKLLIRYSINRVVSLQETRNNIDNIYTIAKDERLRELNQIHMQKDCETFISQTVFPELESIKISDPVQDKHMILVILDPVTRVSDYGKDLFAMAMPDKQCPLVVYNEKSIDLPSKISKRNRSAKSKANHVINTDPARIIKYYINPNRIKPYVANTAQDAKVLSPNQMTPINSKWLSKIVRADTMQARLFAGPLERIDYVYKRMYATVTYLPSIHSIAIEKACKDKMVNVTGIVDRLRSHFPDISISRSGVATYMGYFIVESLDLNPHVLLDLIMLNPILRRYIHLDEIVVVYAQRKQLRFRFDIGNRTSVSICINTRTAKASNSFHCNGIRRILRPGTVYTEVRFSKVKSEKQITICTGFVTKMIGYYLHHYQPVAAFYKHIVKSIVDTKSPIVTRDETSRNGNVNLENDIFDEDEDVSSLTMLRKSNPTMFVSNYTRIAQKGLLVKILTSDIKRYTKDGYDVIRLPCYITNARKQMDGWSTGPYAYYISADDTKRYLGPVQNTLPNHDAFPYIFRSYKKQYVKIGLANVHKRIVRSVKHILSEMFDDISILTDQLKWVVTITKINKDYKQQTTELINDSDRPQGWMIELTPEVSNFMTNITSSMYRFKKYTVQRSPNSLLHALCTATSHRDYIIAEERALQQVSEEYDRIKTEYGIRDAVPPVEYRCIDDVFDRPEERARETIVRNIRNNMLRNVYPEICAQSLFDFNRQDVIDLLHNADAYLDSILFIAMVEEYFNCHIFIINIHNRSNNGDLMFIPRHKGRYLFNGIADNKPCVFLVRHMASEASLCNYPRNDLIVMEITSDKQMERDIAKSNSSRLVTISRNRKRKAVRYKFLFGRKTLQNAFMYMYTNVTRIEWCISSSETLSSQSLFMPSMINLLTVDDISTSEQYQYRFIPKQQVLDSYGKLRGIVYKTISYTDNEGMQSKKNKVTIFTDPLPPVNIKSIALSDISLTLFEDALHVVDFISRRISDEISQFKLHIVLDHVYALSFRIYSVTQCIIEIVPVNMNVVTSHSICKKYTYTISNGYSKGIIHHHSSGTISTYNYLARVARIIKTLAETLYVLSPRTTTHRASESAFNVVSSFCDKHTIVSYGYKNYDLKNVKRHLPSDLSAIYATYPSFFRNKRLILDNKESQRRIIELVMRFEERIRIETALMPQYTQQAPIVINEFYTNLNDYMRNTSRYVRICRSVFILEQDLVRCTSNGTLRVISASNIIETSSSSHPYILFVDETMYIVQSVSDTSLPRSVAQDTSLLPIHIRIAAICSLWNRDRLLMVHNACVNEWFETDNAIYEAITYYKTLVHIPVDLVMSKNVIVSSNPRIIDYQDGRYGLILPVSL